MQITPFLWFDGQAEEAARFYTSIIKDSRIIAISRYPDAGREHHGNPPGTVMVVEFDLNGQRYYAMNGGSSFPFDYAVSFVIHCADQAELDDYWEKLSEGGDPEGQQCGWLKDKFGLSWQLWPKQLPEWLSAKDPEAVKRVFTAVLGMRKFVVSELEKAFAG